MKKIAVVISCEHAVDTVPEQYHSLFTPFRSLLATHRGIDFGALAIAECLRSHIPGDFIQATCTRLLVDCNKSIHHPRCFSEVTQNLSPQEKERILELYYWPFRNAVMASIKKNIEQGSQVWHFSIHSFTPIFNGIMRTADIGILYDPQRSSEKKLAREWTLEIKKQSREYRIRMNYPYKGISDGFTRTMRKQYTSSEYVGIELEANQALTLDDRKLDALKHILTNSLLSLLC